MPKSKNVNGSTGTNHLLKSKNPNGGIGQKKSTCQNLKIQTEALDQTIYQNLKMQMEALDKKLTCQNLKM